MIWLLSWKWLKRPLDQRISTINRENTILHHKAMGFHLKSTWLKLWEIPRKTTVCSLFPNNSGVHRYLLTRIFFQNIAGEISNSVLFKYLILWIYVSLRNKNYQNFYDIFKYKWLEKIEEKNKHQHLIFSLGGLRHFTLRYTIVKTIGYAWCTWQTIFF